MGCLWKTSTPELRKEEMKNIASRKFDLNDIEDFSHMGKGISYCPLITEDTLSTDSTDQDHDKTIEEQKAKVNSLPPTFQVMWVTTASSMPLTMRCIGTIFKVPSKLTN